MLEQERNSKIYNFITDNTKKSYIHGQYITNIETIFTFREQTYSRKKME